MENVRAKKFLGQHFLTDIHIAESICNLLNRNTKKVVEIGPGMGVLTQFLIKMVLISEAVLFLLSVKVSIIKNTPLLAMPSYLIS